MTDTKQPEALRLAGIIEQFGGASAYEAAAELRRLHAENVALQRGYDAARLEIDHLRGATKMVEPALGGDPVEPRDDSDSDSDSDSDYDRPIGYLPANELHRLHSGHDANLRSAKFGPSELDADVPVYLAKQPTLVEALREAQRAIQSMKVEAETAAQGDEQMMLEACEQISNEGLEASEAIRATLTVTHQPAAQALEDTDVLSMSRALILQRATDAKDAARYRWLRSRDIDTINAGGVFAGKTPDNVVLNGEDLDAAIDAARAQEQRP